MKATLFSLLLCGALGEIVEVTDCSDYDCPSGRGYLIDGTSMKYVYCSQKGKDPTYGNWFSKTYGDLEHGSLVGDCQSRGFDSVDTNVFQAVPRPSDPNQLSDPALMLCNKRFAAEAHNTVPHDAVTPNSETSKEHQSWRCLNYPSPDKPVGCCKHITDFGEHCTKTRNEKNNFSRCGQFDSCKDSCSGNPDATPCFNCCYILKGGNEWKCWDSPTGAPSPNPPTSSPVDPTDAPSRTPTSSPVDPTDKPSGNPTSAPVVSTDAQTSSPVDPTDKPSGTPTSSPVDSTDAPSVTPTASPVDQTDVPSRTPTASPVENSSPGPTFFDKSIAELICTSATSKQKCKHALNEKTEGKCKWKAGKKGKGGKCHLKSFVAPLDCESLKKRQCKKAKKKGQCVAGDSKGTCRGKALE